MKRNITLHVTHKTLNSRRAFTVMEVLIAMTIIAIILSSVFVIFKGATGSWKRGEAKANLYQMARSIFDIASRDVSQSVKGVCLINGDVADLFVGKKSSLHFVSPVGDDGEFVEISYVLDNGRLRRRVGDTIDGNFNTFDYDESLSEDVTAITFSYLYQGEWLDSFDASDLNSLPKAVRLKLELDKNSFEVIIKIETA